MKLVLAIMYVVFCALFGGAVVIGYALIQENGSPYPEGVLGAVGLLLGFLSMPGVIFNQFVVHSSWFGVISINAVSYAVVSSFVQVCRVLLVRYLTIRST
jgi:hypothetical protein